MPEYIITIVIRENDHYSACKAAEGIADSAEAIILNVTEIEEENAAQES